MTADEIIDDRDVLLSRIAADASAFKYASEKLRSDRDVVLAAIALSGKSLRFAARELKADREIVLEAIKKSGRALQYASSDLQADREVVMAAISETPGAMRYASESLKDDRQFVLKAIENSHGAFIQLADRYGSDEGMVLAALGHHLDHQRREVFEKASDQLTTNRDFILRCVSEVDGELLGFVPEVFRADGDIVLAAVKHNGLALRHAAEKFRSDLEIVRQAVRQNSLALQEAAEELQTDSEMTSLLRRIAPANSPIDAIVGTRRAKITVEHGKIVICDPNMVHSKNKLLDVGPGSVGLYEVVDLEQENTMIGYFLQVGESTLSGHEQSESVFTVTGTDVATLLVMDASKSDQVVFNEESINWDFEGGYRTNESYSDYGEHTIELFCEEGGMTRGILLVTYGDWEYPVRALYEGEEKSLIGYLLITDVFSPVWVWGMNERATN